MRQTETAGIMASGSLARIPDHILDGDGSDRCMLPVRDATRRKRLEDLARAFDDFDATTYQRIRPSSAFTNKQRFFRQSIQGTPFALVIDELLSGRGLVSEAWYRDSTVGDVVRGLGYHNRSDQIQVAEAIGCPQHGDPGSETVQATDIAASLQDLSEYLELGLVA